LYIYLTHFNRNNRTKHLVRIHSLDRISILPSCVWRKCLKQYFGNIWSHSASPLGSIIALILWWLFFLVVRTCSTRWHICIRNCNLSGFFIVNDRFPLNPLFVTDSIFQIFLYLKYWFWHIFFTTGRRLFFLARLCTESPQTIRR